jgi:hypothetical protein
MNKLIIHHTYINGMAFDASNNRNHGVPTGVTQAPPPYSPSFAFAAPNSQVVVRPAPSLQDLIAIRARVTFNLEPRTANWHRYNLMEGHLSYALFIQPDGALMGTILDATGNWLGARSDPNTVTAGSWHEAELRHDGINECVVLLDGQAVATSYAARGPVRSVGAHGVAVGHWPETSGVYTFEGHIRESWLYKFDPVDAAKSLLDPCCDKGRKALDDAADRLRAQGYTAEMARDQGMAILNFALGTCADVRGSDPATSQQQRDLSSQALGAFMRRDSASYTTAFAQLAALAGQKLSPGQMQELSDTEKQLVEALPMPFKDWQNLIASVCLNRTTLDLNQFVSDHGRFEKKRSRHDKR